MSVCNASECYLVSLVAVRDIVSCTSLHTKISSTSHTELQLLEVASVGGKNGDVAGRNGDVVSLGMGIRGRGKDLSPHASTPSTTSQDYKTEDRLIDIVDVTPLRLDAEFELLAVNDTQQTMEIQFILRMQLDQKQSDHRALITSLKTRIAYIFSNCRHAQLNNIKMAGTGGHLILDGTATLDCNLYLKNFPRDEHTLTIPFEPFLHAERFDHFDVVVQNKFLNMWRVGHISQQLNSEGCLQICICIQRKPFYYYTHGILPASVIMLLQFSVYFSDNWVLNDRINISSALLLTHVALIYAMGNNLPKVHYNTSFDKMIQANILWILLSLIGSIVCQRRDREWDRWCGVAVFSSWLCVSLFLLRGKRFSRDDSTKKPFTTFSSADFPGSQAPNAAAPS